MNLFTLDTETTLNGNPDMGIGHPMHTDNVWVLVGYKVCDNPVVWVHTSKEKWKVGNDSKTMGVDFLVGHNIPFDLLGLYKANPINKLNLQTYKLWDTQFAEYLLSGQQDRWISLDELSARYGFPLKDDKIKKYFEAGIGSDKIPEKELIPYLEQDVSNTENIALIQIKRAVEEGMLDFIVSQMEALHATTEMMFNGLRVDTKYLEEYTKECCSEYLDTTEEVQKLIPDVDINSPKQLSLYFFGGEKKIKEKEVCGLYKNGKPKYKTVEKVLKVGMKFIPMPEWKSEKTGLVSVDEEVLEYMVNYPSATAYPVVTAAKALLKYRTINKQLTTYIQGMSKHICKDYIYGSINHTATVTGRLSSTKPNLQNISNNPIKKMFVSRFPEGSLVEFDFQQLEIAALAHLTGDEQLIEDISSGKDIHSELYSSMYGKIPTKEERKPFKSLSFGLIYGAGGKTLAKNASCSEGDAKKFIDTFYDRYPKVQKWHQRIYEQAQDEGVYLIKDEVRELTRTFTLKSETTRKYVFKEYEDSKGWSSRKFNFSPTELKNYPDQGLATGDIVPLMLGILFRKFGGRDDVKMVNTVHDSILFDCTNEAIEGGFIEEVRNVLNNTHKYFEGTFGKPLALKLTAGVSVGKNWFEMKEIV